MKIGDVVEKMGYFIIIIFWVINGNLNVLDKIKKKIFVVMKELNYYFNNIV